MAYAMAKWKMTDHDVLNAGTGFAMRAPEPGRTLQRRALCPRRRLRQQLPGRKFDAQAGARLAGGPRHHLRHGPFRYGGRGFYATMWDYIMPTPAYTCATAGTPTNVLDRNFWAFPSDWREDLLNGTTNADTSMAGYQMGNIRLATLGGGDLFGEVQVCKGLSVFGCMSYIHGENLSRVQFVDSGYNDSVKSGSFVRLGGTESLPDIYPFNGRIAVRVCDPDKGKWGVEFIARLVHSQDEVAWSIGQIPSPGFTVYDLKGYYCWSKNLRLTLALDNLLESRLLRARLGGDAEPGGRAGVYPRAGFHDGPGRRLSPLVDHVDRQAFRLPPPAFATALLDFDLLSNKLGPALLTALAKCAILPLCPRGFEVGSPDAFSILVRVPALRA